MSDGKTEAMRGTYFSKNEIQHNKEYYDVNRNRSRRDKNLIPEINHMPNQKWHKIISFIKSGIRILGYVIIPFDLVIATGVLILSEVIGIVEELV
jgi:hypothetical protein